MIAVAVQANLAKLGAQVSFPLIHIAIGSSAIFDNGGDQFVDDLEGWRAFTLEREQVAMPPGPGFNFFRKMMALNRYSPDPRNKPLVKFHVISSQAPDISLRFIYSLKHYGLLSDPNLCTGCFLGSSEVPDVMKALMPLQGSLLPMGLHLFASSNADVVRAALGQGIAAAHLETFEHKIIGLRSQQGDADDVSPLTVVFDCDAIIFDDASERVFAEQGLKAFYRHERERLEQPLELGPLQRFFLALCYLRSLFPFTGEEGGELAPLRIGLASARNLEAGARVLHTLRQAEIRVDFAEFLAGEEKGPFLRHGEADIVFDDSRSNVASAQEHGIPAGHVPWGVRNEEG